MENGGPGVLTLLVQLAIIVLMVVSVWKVFVKAGQPGWACLVPIYNLYILLKIAGKPAWWILCFFIPIVNIVFAVLASIGLAEKFGKGTGFGFGLALLGFIFYPILAFGSDTYQG